MDDTRRTLAHFLAALAYRTQKALRGAPVDFADFSAGAGTRTPRELVRHMAGVLVTRARSSWAARTDPIPSTT